MRFTQVRTAEQVDLQALHRIRDQFVSSRTRLINQVRAFASNTASRSQGAGELRLDLPRVLADETNDLTATIRRVLTELFEDVVRLDQRIAGVTPGDRGARRQRPSEHARLRQSAEGVCAGQSQPAPVRVLPVKSTGSP